jgi:hypothetical protein
LVFFLRILFKKNWFFSILSLNIWFIENWFLCFFSLSFLRVWRVHLGQHEFIFSLLYFIFPISTLNIICFIMKFHDFIQLVFDEVTPIWFYPISFRWGYPNITIKPWIWHVNSSELRFFFIIFFRCQFSYQFIYYNSFFYLYYLN